MRYRLLASSCLIAVATIAPLRAETTVTAKRTDPVRTSTIKSGAADDVRITSAGSVELTGGVAVTVDSANKVTNEGTIQITNANGATGILANAGTSGGISNTGKIVIDETFAPTDIDNDGDLDGPFAVGRGRTGIATAGAYSGSISNSGTITIEGNDSFGIRLGGPLTGNFVHDGTTTVTGDRAVGASLTDVTGNVRLAGTITATGLNGTAARLDGNVSGALVVQGALNATGYRFTTPPTDPSKLDADDLLQGGPALVVAGNVAGGIILAVPPKDSSPSDNDEDKDGIEDSKEGSATIRSFGSAPAMRIGGAGRAISIGPVAGTGTGFGLIIDGGILGSGLYAGKTATGLEIGDLAGSVTIAGGIGVNGSVQATANGASATAIRFGAGAQTPEIRVAGKVEAAGGGSAALTSGILVETGGSVPTIRNSGLVKAATGTDGIATAILDRSGTAGLVENSGEITASGAPATSDRNVAIDLSTNGAGATVRQTAVASGVTAPAINGEVRFGAGNDLFDVADGSVKGTSRFGAGNNRLNLSGDATYEGSAAFGAGNDTMALTGSASFSGAADFGGGADTLSIGGTSRFSGSLANAQGLGVTVNGGTFDVSKAAQIGSLAVNGGGVLGVMLDKTGGTGTLIQVSGSAAFEQNSKLAVKLASVENAEGRYVVLRAGTLTGASNIAAATTAMPFLFKGVVSAQGNELAVDVTRKSKTELGLNRSQASAFDAVVTAMGKEKAIGDIFLNITDGDGFRGTMRQMMPEHSGGTFAAVTGGSRALARGLTDPNAPFKDEGKWGYWIDQAGWGASKSVGETAGYDITGWGIAGGAEVKTGAGRFGASLAYLYGKNGDNGTENEVGSDQWEFAGYWRLKTGGWQLHARGSAAYVSFDGTRRFLAMVANKPFSRTSTASWNGTLFAGSAGISYDTGGGPLVFRPAVAIDYNRLKEDGYTETGGGSALDLIVDERTSDELAVTGTAALGLNLGGRDQYDGWYRYEIEGGRRQIIGGALGNTTARFAGGAPFILVPEDRTNGWVGRLRAVAGNSGFQIGGEASAEEQQSRVALSFRASIRLGL